MALVDPGLGMALVDPTHYYVCRGGLHSSPLTSCVVALRESRTRDRVAPILLQLVLDLLERIGLLLYSQFIKLL